MHLQTARLLLRAMRPSDDKDLFSIYGDPATNTFNPAGPYPDLAHAQKVLADRLASFQRYGYDSWAIATQEAPEIIIGFGGLSVRTYGERIVNNLGYRFATHAWGKGFATELSRFAVDYGFGELGLETISASVRRPHQASIRVLEKTGLRFIDETYDVDNAPPSLFYSINHKAWQVLRAAGNTPSARE